MLTVVSKYDEEESLSALGLDSLDLVQLRNNFVSTFGIKVPLSAFAAHKTLGELVEELQALLTKLNVLKQCLSIFLMIFRCLGST